MITGSPADAAPQSQAGRRGRFSHGLALLRGIAATVVVLFHSFLTLRIAGIDDAYLKPIDLRDPWLTVMHLILGAFNGPACVTLFFVLSGTVLALSLEGERSMSVRAIIAYWIRRFFRLYPLLFAAAGLAALLQVFYFGTEVFPAGTTWLNLSYKVGPDAVWHELWRNALGLSASLNSPAWSIKIEIVVSVIFPALFLLSRRAAFAAVTMLVLLLLMFVWPTQRYPLAKVPVFLISFFIGAVIPVWGSRLVARLKRLGAASFRSIFLGAIIVLMFAHRILAPDAIISPDVVLLESAASGLIVVMILFGPDRPIYRTWTAQTLGEISYAVYLLHLIVLNVIAHWLLPRLPAPMSGGQALSYTCLLAFAVLSVSLPLAFVFHYVLERPLRLIGRLAARQVMSAGGGSRPTQATPRGAFSS